MSIADATSPAWRPTFTLGQDRPAEICPIPPREQEEREITHNNPVSCYGIGSILRRYAGLPADFPLQISAEHFICYQPDKVVQWDIDAGYRTMFTVDGHRAKIYQEAGAPRTLPVGFAIHYAQRLHEMARGPLKPPHQRRGTLVFPHKSDAVVRDRIFDHAPFIAWMRALPEEFHPLYVCLYWKNYNQGEAKPFEDAGYPVLSCGHWMHEDFLLRFVEMCGQFRYVAANAYSSSFPLSILCGCHFLYVDTGGHTEQYYTGKTVVHATDPSRETVYGRAAQAITTYPPVEAHRAAQLALARRMSGHRHVRHRWRIWWELRREARHMASLRGEGLDFSNGNLPWKQLRPWCCQGIERDGWVHTQASLSTPSSGEIHSVLILDWDLPQWSAVKSQQLTVEVTGKKNRQVKLKAGRQWRLRVPLPTSPREARVRLQFAEPFPLPGEARTACARLLRFHLEKDSSSHPDISLELISSPAASLEKK